MTSVEYVTVLALSTNVDVLISQRETVIVMATSLMRLVNVMATVKRTLMRTESVIQKSKDVQIQKTLTTIQVLHLTMGLV